MAVAPQSRAQIVKWTNQFPITISSSNRLIILDEGTPMAHEHLSTIYQELCTMYRAIDDFRAKLLGFLPLVSGAGVFFLLDGVFAEQAKRNVVLPSLEPIGLFGCAVTFGLFS